MKLYDLNIRDHLMKKNFSKGRSKKIDRIVIHHNAGHGVDPYQTWQTREASAHYQVWSDGKIDNLVRDADTAWHAHEANDDSIGIEHENDGGGNLAKRGWPINEKALHASAKLVGYLCAKHKLGAPKFGKNVTTHNAIESDGKGVDSGTACPGPDFIKILKTSDHWYWKEAVAAYKKGTGTSSKPPATKPPTTKPSKPAKPGKKTVNQLAKEVIAGKWGNGPTRKAKLLKAGYSYKKVQAEVNRILASQ